MTDREKEVLDHITGILKEHTAPRKIYLFGSRAKGNAGRQADFDVAVDADLPDEQKRREIQDLIDEGAGLYSVDVIFLSELDPDFLQIVLKNGRIIYEGRS